MLKSWASIVAEARAELWPFPGEAKPQIAAHTKEFKLAAQDLQHWIPELQVKNTSLFPFCSTLFSCGQSVFDAPVGIVRRVYTIANDEWCDRVFYREGTFTEVECWTRNIIEVTSPTNSSSLPPLPMGIRYANASTDLTVEGFDRSRNGIWAKHRHRIHLVPWIQSNETIVVEWDGTKKTWEDSDQLETDLWSDEVINAIKLYVKWKHEVFFGCDIQKKQDLEREYQNARADLIHYFREISRQRETEACPENREPTYAELVDDAVPEEETTMFAFIADFDGRTDQARTVAEMVASWEPQFIVTGGDNIYGNTDRETNIGELYGDYITDQLHTNRFFPALGNHDYDDGGIQGHYDFFKLPNNERYYDFVSGPVHVFILNSQDDEPDGRTSTSIQGKWLQAKLALSTATWKIVVTQDPPYTTAPADDPGHAVMRWPYKEWGADLVLSGDTHAYERFEGIGALAGLPCIVGGWSGRDLDTLSGTTDATVKFTYDDNYGALRITASCDELLVEAINMDNTLIDSLTIER